MDDIDQANDLAAAEVESAIQTRVKYDNYNGADDCVICGEEIPEARRKALPSANRCISCQSASER